MTIRNDKKRIMITLGPETIEKLSKLSKTYHISKSLAAEQAINNEYNSNLYKRRQKEQEHMDKYMHKWHKKYKKQQLKS